ncbi:MAG: hypothetical protein K5880_22055 [Hydrogenophaga sp.]|uniref:hypothetical protein n=1 Tax=Hydrogenophaga sp. TaxID=1904254 RepID=UPI00262FD4EA|nr:hypothetical protein [Hydrogenophaga sp.]MCV0441287.1 hypothetical protein [Hydrogenophaga sp.]
MQRTVLLWVFIGVTIAILAAIKAAGAAYPVAASYAQDSMGLLLGSATAIMLVWGVLRRRALKEHFPEVLRATGWLLLAWSAIGWWNVAAEAGALGASLFFFPVAMLAGLVIAMNQEERKPPSSLP